MNNTITADSEKVLFRTYKHPVIYLIPILLTGTMIVAGFNLPKLGYIHEFPWIPTLIGMTIWWYVFLEFAVCQCLITSKRIRIRKGLFLSHSYEIRLSAILQIRIQQSIFARMINCASISINAFGIFDTLNLLAKPYQFEQYLNQSLELHAAR